MDVGASSDMLITGRLRMQQKSRRRPPHWIAASPTTPVARFAVAVLLSRSVRLIGWIRGRDYQRYKLLLSIGIRLPTQLIEVLEYPLRDSGVGKEGNMVSQSVLRHSASRIFAVQW